MSTLKEKLAQFVEDGEHKEVLDITDKILKRKNDDNIAKQCKQVALIQSGEFKKALEMIEQSAHQQSKQTQMFQKAYCLYRLNRCEEALQTLNSVETHNQVLLSHLKAQVEYKMGQYGKSVQTYEQLDKLIQSLPRDEQEEHDQDELLTNFSAAYTLNHDYESALKTCKRGSTYELSYNASGASINLKQYDQAMAHLKEAERKCRQAAKEDQMTEEEINNELAAIIVQTAYVKQLTGDLDGALEIYSEIMKNKPSDKVAVAVAANNLLAIHSERQDEESNRSLFDSWKKLKLATQDKVKDKLTTEQQRGIDLNIALLHLHMNKLSEARQEIVRVSEAFPNSDIPALLQAALLLKEKKPKNAVEVLEKYIAEHGRDNSQRVQLSLAQIRLNREEWAEAAATLQQTTISTQPSIVRLITELYQKAGDAKSGLTFLNNAIKHCQQQYETKKDATTKSQLVNICLASAKWQEEQRKHREAAQTYKMLSELDSQRKTEFVARMVNALTFIDMEEAEKYLAQLPAIPTNHLDADELVANKTNPFGDYQKVKPAASKVDEEQKKKNKKTKRKNKAPKNPNAPIDPNRWVSKKKKKVTQTKGTGFGTQGSDQANPSLLHEKGHKTIHRPEQVHGARTLPKGVVQKKKKGKK